MKEKKQTDGSLHLKISTGGARESKKCDRFNKGPAEDSTDNIDLSGGSQNSTSTLDAIGSSDRLRLNLSIPVPRSHFLTSQIREGRPTKRDVTFPISDFSERPRSLFAAISFAFSL